MNIDLIRTLTMRAKTEGIAEASADLKGLASAHDAVAKAAVVSSNTTDTSAKRQLSLADAVDKAERRFNSALRAQQDFEKIQRQMNAAVAQNPALQDRANAVLAAAAMQYGQAGLAAKAFAAATSGVSAQLIALSAGAGPVGTFLAALGPWGLAAAVGIGAAEKALTMMSDASHALAQKSEELRKFSEVTGLTTDQVQALRSEASKFGVTGDEVQSSIQQFTARFNDLRVGQGELLTQIRRLPLGKELADQMAGASGAADALTIFGKALQDVDNVFQRNALVKAATGKGGLTSASFLTGLNVDQVTQSYVNAGKALDENLIKKLAQLEIDIAKTSSKARDNIASIFAQDVLEAELKWAKAFLSLSETMKNFSASSGWSTFVNTAFGLANIVPILGPLLNVARGVTNLLPPSGSSFNDRFSAANDNPLKPYTPKPDQAAVDPRYTAETLSKQIAAMGDAATAAEKLELAQMQLAISGKDAALSGEQLTRAENMLNETFNNQRIQATVSALGSAATVTEQFTARVSALKLELDKGNISRETFNRAIGGLQQDQQLTQMRDRIAALGILATDTDQYALRVAELKQQLDQGRISQETYNQALLAADPIFQKLKSATDGFGQNLLSNLLSGQNAFKALTGAAQQYISTMASDTLKRVQSGGSLFGNQELGSLNGAVGMASAGLAGYQSGSPLAGALGGAMAGAAFGPVGMVAGGIIGGAGGLFGADAQKKAAEEAHQKEVQAAKDAWDNMEGAWRSFIGTISGHNIGSVQSSILDARSQEQQYVSAAAHAADLHGSETTTDIVNTQMATDMFVSRTFDEFRNNWQETVNLMQQGIGTDGPFGQALAAIKQTAAQVEGFVSDTAYVGADDANTARAAAQSYLLTLLKTAPALTETQTEIQALNGKVSGLQQSLIDLGMSSDDAAAAINSGATAAMDQFRATFTKNAQAKLYDASGLGYINEIQNLADEVATMRTDAAAVGADAGLVGRYFSVAAQKIIDGSQLTGAAFDQLSSMFPDLAGNVHAYTAALDANSQSVQTATQTLQSAFDRTKQFVAGLKDFQKSLLLDNSLSTLSPSDRLAEAARQYQSTQAGALGGNAADQANLQNATTAYLNEAKSYYASSAGYAAIFNEVQAGNQGVIDAAQGQIDLAQQQVNILQSIDSNVISLADALQGYKTATTVASTSTSASAGTPTLWGTDIAVSAASADQMKAAAIAQARGAWAGLSASQTAHASDVAAAIALYRTQPGTGYAAGGVVGNGIWNMDSVRAHYAGGGDVMLAGGEGVINAAATRMIGPSVIDLMNRTGQIPQSSNDNSREIGMAINRQTDMLTRDNAALHEEVAGMRQEIKNLNSKLAMILAAA